MDNINKPGIQAPTYRIVVSEITPRQQRSTSNHIDDVMTFVAPACVFLEIRAVGRLFVSELLLLGLLPFLLLSRRHRLQGRLTHRILIIGVGWLCQQIITDLLRGTSLEDYARGWSKIAFTLVSMVALHMLIAGVPRRIVLYAAGISVGQILSYFFNDNPYAVVDPWKFGVGTPITFVLIILATFSYRAGTRVLTNSIIAVTTLTNLVLGFRSLAGVCFLTLTFLLSQRVISKHRTNQKAARRRAAMVVVALCASAFCFVEGYQYAAEDGILGQQALVKQRAQTGDLTIIAGGRAELLITLQAIRKSPLIGYGSWAKDPDQAWGLRDVLLSHGYRADWVPQSDLIPTHSYLMGAWVEAGILGALFWGGILVLAVRALYLLQRMNSSLNPLLAFSILFLIWNVLFSPLGAEHRLIAAYFTVIVFSIHAEQVRASSSKLRCSAAYSSAP